MEPTEQAREVSFAEYNVIAAYPNMDAARKAMDALEAGGIDAVHVSLLGPRAEEAAERADTRERDERVVRHVGKRAGVGAAAGTAAGGIAGLIAGAVAFAIPGVGPVIGAGVWAAIAGGAVAGGAVGGVIGGVSSLDMTEAWELTYQSVRKGQILVGVHSEDADEADHAAEILRGEDALAVERFDRRGKRLS